MKELHNFVAGFYECIKLKMRWELKEDEWVDWLKTLRSLVARARNQFLSFEASFGSYGVEDVESRRWAEVCIELSSGIHNNSSIIFRKTFKNCVRKSYPPMWSSTRLISLLKTFLASTQATFSFLFSKNNYQKSVIYY